MHADLTDEGKTERDEENGEVNEDRDGEDSDEDGSADSEVADKEQHNSGDSEGEDEEEEKMTATKRMIAKAGWTRAQGWGGIRAVGPCRRRAG